MDYLFTDGNVATAVEVLGFWLFTIAVCLLAR